jgi:hypothetical protein
MSKKQRKGFSRLRKPFFVMAATQIANYSLPDLRLIVIRLPSYIAQNKTRS